MDNTIFNVMKTDRLVVTINTIEEYKSFLCICEMYGLKWNAGQNPTNAECIGYFKNDYEMWLTTSGKLQRADAGKGRNNSITYNDFVDIICGIKTINEAMYMNKFSIAELEKELSRRKCE